MATMAGPVRQPIDQPALEAYFAKHIPEAELPLQVRQFSLGQSNPTYQLTTASGARLVLRKKPPGTLLSGTAHRVEREYRIMRALSSATAAGAVPVPQMRCLCEDPAVLGTPFFIMSFLDGRVFEDPTMPGVAESDRTAMWRDAVRALAAFHAVDPADAGLADFGKPAGFYPRQVATWSRICAAQSDAADTVTGEKVGPLPHMAELVRFFADRGRQPRDRATLVHGDYKIDNLVFHRTEPRVIGILDWEMSTIGHPLSDICNLLMPFHTASASAPPSFSSLSSLPAAAAWSHPGFLPGATPGLPTCEQLLSWYSDASRASASSSFWYDPDVSGDVAWGMAWTVFRLAAICQGIAARQAARQASSAQAERHAAERGPLAECAWVLASRAGAATMGGEGDRAKL